MIAAMAPGTGMSGVALRRGSRRMPPVTDTQTSVMFFLCAARSSSQS